MVAVKSWFRIASSLLLALTGAVAFAQQSASSDLQARLLGLDGIMATFEQQISNAQGFLLEKSHGTLHLAKPRFRWELKDPYPQIILADGDRIQIYDPDLEQVTERRIEGSAEQAPLALLTQAQLDLDEHFSVSISRSEAELTHFVLRPRSTDALYSRMELVFRMETLSRLIIYDHAGQQTLVQFADYLTQQVIQSSVFELEFPPGTDFVRG